MNERMTKRDKKEMAELRAALEKATEMAGALNKKCDLITKKLEQLSDAYHVVGDSDDAEGGLRMERLNFEGNFCEIAQCKEVKCPYDTACSQKQVWERLKQYEDTGLSPIACEESAKIEKGLSDGGYSTSRMVELMCADKEGRVVVLPCKVGDVVYGFHGEKTILPMVAKWIETNTDGWCIAVQYTPMAPRFYRFSDFGKTVFLTREEAKKALHGMEE